jgi:hypothetical protein
MRKKLVPSFLIYCLEKLIHRPFASLSRGAENNEFLFIVFSPETRPPRLSNRLAMAGRGRKILYITPFTEGTLVPRGQGWQRQDVFV